jgi:hypothetical protein
MEHYYQNIGENWFDYGDLYSSIVLKYPNGSHFVEVGSWKGRSAVYMGVEIYNSQKNIKFDCVDTWKGSPEVESHMNDPAVKEDKLYEVFLENIKPLSSIIIPIKNTSVEASKLYKEKSLQFVFIDASHEYEFIKEDIQHWLPKIAPGGILAGHDCNYGPVDRAINELLPGVKKSGSCWIFEL